MIRLALRGGVVRLSDFAGSGLLILITGVIEPRMISMFAIPLALIWVVTSFRLKKAYPDILIQSLKTNRNNWKQMEDDQIQLLAKDRHAFQFFQKGLAVQSNETALLCAEIIARSRPDLLAESLLPLIAKKTLEVRKKWLDLLTSENIGTHLPNMYELAGSAALDSLPYWLETLNRIDPNESGRFMENYLSHPDLRVKAEAFTGACLNCNLEKHDEYRRRINQWLNDDESHVRLALKVLSKTGDLFYSRKMIDIFLHTRDPDLKAWSLESLSKMNHEQVVSFAVQASSDSSNRVRMASLNAISSVEPQAPAEMILKFLTDFDEGVRSEAFRILSGRGRVITPVLLRALAGHSHVLQEQVIQLLKLIGVPHVDLSRFVLEQLKRACHYLSCMHAFPGDIHDGAMFLLNRCLADRYQEIIEIVLRVLGIIEFNDRMRIILQAVQSGKRKDIDNAIEALESALHTDLRYALIPLLEDKPLLDRLTASCRAMRIEPVFFTSIDQVFDLLLHEDGESWIKALCLYAAGENQVFKIDSSRIRRLAEDSDPIIFEAVAWLQADIEKLKIHDKSRQPSELVNKTIYLGNNLLFQGLKTKELLSVARACRLLAFKQGDVILHEKTKALGVYIQCKGNMAFKLKSLNNYHARIEADLLSKGLAGEMQWIDNQDQLYTVKGETDCLVLEIPGEKFSMLLVEYPGLVLTLCRFYSHRNRMYQQVISKRKPGARK